MSTTVNKDLFNNNNAYTFTSGAVDIVVEADDYSNKSLDTGDGNDTILNSGNHISINAGTGNDSIHNTAVAPVLVAGEGSDTITNSGQDATIDAGLDNDFIVNSGTGASINAAEGNDTIVIENSGARSTIYAGKGEDLLSIAGGSNVIEFDAASEYDTVVGFKPAGDLINIKSGNISEISSVEADVSGVAHKNLLLEVGNAATLLVDNAAEAEVKVVRTGYSDVVSTLNAGVLKTSLKGSGHNFTGSDAKDIIYTDGSSSSTINAGAGNDTLFITNNDVVLYNSGDGEDVIYLKGSDFSLPTLKTSKVSNYSISGSDHVVTFLNGSLTLKNVSPATTKNLVHIVDDNSNNYMFVAGRRFYYNENLGTNDDFYLNTLQNAQVEALGGNDYIINSGAGAKIFASNGADTIVNEANAASLFGDAGNDLIQSANANNVYIDAGDGDDSIEVQNGSNVTIKGGAGNDTIRSAFINKPVEYVQQLDEGTIAGTLSGSYYIQTLASGAVETLELKNERVIEFAAGEGNDVIMDYSSADTLHITSGAFKYSTLSGSDVILYIGDDTTSSLSSIKLLSAYNTPITIIDAKGNHSTQLYGNNGSTIEGTGANNETLRGTAGNDLLIGKTSSEVFVGGLGDDSMSLGGGADTVFYSAGKDVVFGYVPNAVLAFDSAVSLTDVSVDAGDVVFSLDSGSLRVVGAASNSKIATSFNNVVSAQMYGSADVVVSDGDGSSLDFALNHDAVNFNLLSRTESLLLNANAAANVVSLGAADTTVDAAGGNDIIYAASKNASVNAGAGDDTVYFNTGMVTAVGGAGNDVFVVQSLAGGANSQALISDYAAGDFLFIDNNSIKSVSVSGDDLLLDIGLENESHSLTLAGAANTKINIVESDFSYSQFMNSPAVTVAASDGDTFRANPNVNFIDASKRTTPLTIIANDTDSTIYAGSKNDLVFSGSKNDLISLGAGVDTLVYAGGDDSILDYANGDLLSLNAAMSFKNDENTNFAYTVKDSDVSLFIADGNGDVNKVFLKNAKGKSISYIENGVAKTLVAANFYEKVFGASEAVANNVYVADNLVVTIDASARAASKALAIKANDAANIIKGSAGADTLYAEAGNDTITGGKGKDLFIYSGGSDVITDYTAAEDKISLAGDLSVVGTTLVGSDLQFDISNGEVLTLNSMLNKNGTGKKVTIIQDGVSTSRVYAGSDKATLTVADTDFDSELDLSNDKVVKAVNASARKLSLNITANDLGDLIKGTKVADTITGGKGDDTLTGNGGADYFIVSKGHDYITDYVAGTDVISFKDTGLGIKSSQLVAKSKTSSKNDVEFTLDDADGSTVTIAGAKGKLLTIIDKNGNESTLMYGDDKAATLKVTDAIAAANATIDATNEFISVVNASAVSKNAVYLKGNSNANKLVGGKKNDTLIGSDNDTLTGGSGTDSFVVSGKDVVITDYAAGEELKLESGSATVSKIVGAKSKDVYISNGQETVTIVAGAGKELKINGVSLKYGTDAATLTVSKAQADSTKEYDAATYGSLVKTINAAAAAAGVKLKGRTDGTLLKGGKGADTLEAAETGRSTLTGGSGKDRFVVAGESVIITDYVAGTDEIVLGARTVTKNGVTNISNAKSYNDVVLGLDDGSSVTVLKGLNKKITIEESGGVQKTLTYGTKDVTLTLTNTMVNESETSPTVKTAGYSDLIRTVNGSSLTTKVYVKGNDEGNVIKTGKADDTLEGGAGNDLFTSGKGSDVIVYGGGNDTITDYATNDTVVAAAEVSRSAISGSNLTLTIGEGSLFIKGGKSKAININGKALKYGANEATLTVSAAQAQSESSYAAKDYGSLVKTIDAASTTTGVKLEGNVDNILKGGKGADTLKAGSGLTTLTGGAGADIFDVGSSAAITITDYATMDTLVMSNVEVKGAKVSGNNLELTVGESRVTLTKGKGKVVTLDDGHTQTKQIFDGKNATLMAGDGDIDLTSMSNVGLVSEVNAKARTTGIKVVGNEQVTKIEGGSGSDNLTATAANATIVTGKGADTVSYKGGNIVITDYAVGEDEIDLGSLEVSSAELIKKDVKLGISDGGSILVQNGSNKQLKIKSGDVETNKVYAAVTVKIGDGDETNIDLTNVAYSNVQTLDASAQTQPMKIQLGDKATKVTGGSNADEITSSTKNNYIVGGGGADTIVCKGGNDTLYGGAGDDVISLAGGAEVLIFNVTSSSGDGNDMVYNFDRNTDKIKLSGSAKVTGAIKNGNDLKLIFNSKADGSNDKGSITLVGKANETITVINTKGVNSQVAAADYPELNSFEAPTQNIVEDVWFEVDNFSSQLTDILGDKGAGEYAVGKIETVNLDEIGAIDVTKKITSADE